MVGSGDGCGSGAASVPWMDTTGKGRRSDGGACGSRGGGSLRQAQGRLSGDAGMGSGCWGRRVSRGRGWWVLAVMSLPAVQSVHTLPAVPETLGGMASRRRRDDGEIAALRAGAFGAWVGGVWEALSALGAGQNGVGCMGRGACSAMASHRPLHQRIASSLELRTCRTRPAGARRLRHGARTMNAPPVPAFARRRYHRESRC